MRPVLITAGATRNPVDATRFLSAGSTGSTGVTIACALVGPVHLLASDEARLRLQVRALEGCARAAQVHTEPYSSTRDLLARMQRWVTAHPDGVVVHACAVGDYESDVDTGKIPSGRASLQLALRPAPKILDRIRSWSPTAKIVSFKAAPPGSTLDDLARIAEAQRARTDSALVFANALGRLSEGLVIRTPRSTRTFPTRAAALAALIGELRAMR